MRRGGMSVVGGAGVDERECPTGLSSNKCDERQRRVHGWICLITNVMKRMRNSRDEERVDEELASGGAVDWGARSSQTGRWLGRGIEIERARRARPRDLAQPSFLDMPLGSSSAIHFFRTVLLSLFRNVDPKLVRPIPQTRDTPQQGFIWSAFCDRGAQLDEGLCRLRWPPPE